jgi:hypothetical protein
VEGDGSVSIFTQLRLLIFLRRIAIAQERLAAVAETQLAHDRELWNRERKLTPRPTEFGSFDIDAANDAWRKEEEAREYGGISVVEEVPPK